MFWLVGGAERRKKKLCTKNRGRFFPERKLLYLLLIKWRIARGARGAMWKNFLGKVRSFIHFTSFCMTEFFSSLLTKTNGLFFMAGLTQFTVQIRRLCISRLQEQLCILMFVCSSILRFFFFNSSISLVFMCNCDSMWVCFVFFHHLRSHFFFLSLEQFRRA